MPGDPGHDRKDAIVLALGIVGATIMPHNLYLHSSVVQTRHVVGGARGMIRDTLALVRIDTCVSLFVAMLQRGDRPRRGRGLPCDGASTT